MGKSNLRKSVLIIIIFCSVVSLCYLLGKNYYTILSWVPGRSLSSSEKRVEFLELQLRYISERVSSDMLFPKTNRHVKTHIEEFLRSGEMRKILSRIREGKKIAIDSALYLILIPDKHGGVYGQSDESKLAQTRIAEYVQEIKIPLIFSENIHYSVLPMDWEKLFLDFSTGSKILLGKPLEISLEEFKEKFSRKEKCVWWEFLSELEKVEIIGIDNRELNFFMTHFKQLYYFPVQYGVEEIDENISKVYFSLNFALREQIILANIVLEMKKRSQDKAVIVLGESHTKTFCNLCRKWNVGIEVARFLNLNSGVDEFFRQNFYLVLSIKSVIINL